MIHLLEFSEWEFLGIIRNSKIHAWKESLARQRRNKTGRREPKHNV